MLEVSCNVILGNPQEVLSVLGEEIYPQDQTTELLAQAYLMMGNLKRAGELTQLMMYQNLVSFVGTSVLYLNQSANDLKKAEEIIKRTEAVARLYDLEHLNANGLLQLYLYGW